MTTVRKKVAKEDKCNIEYVVEEDTTNFKKRGRKPKGGKLITKQLSTEETNPSSTNVILHLKCSLKDLNEYNDKMNEQITDPLVYNPSAPTDILTYNDNPTFFHIDNNTSIEPNNAYSNYLCKSCSTISPPEQTEEENVANVKEINQKLKQLKIQLYKNVTDKKSACFWCTYDYDSPPCYIPKYEMDDSITCYGSFCRPECAVAFLMKESIDDSIKFERYHLLNQIYSKIYNFKKNIKPAPNPYYLLDKFYGNLSIQEYRKLLKTEHMLLVIDKPMSRILPELHEDNDDFIMNIYGGIKTTQTQQQNSGVYKVKRQSEKHTGPSKTSIIKNTFGIQ